MNEPQLARSSLLFAFVPALLLLAYAGWRSHEAGVAQRERAHREAAAWEAAASLEPAAAPRPAAAQGSRGAVLHLELQLATPGAAALAPVAIRLRAREGAERPFDLTVSEAQPTRRFEWPLELPVREPELPLRVDLMGDGWCLAPGLTATTIRAIDAPFRLQLTRAQRAERQFQAEGTLAPLADVELRHESGALLGRSDGTGRISFLRPLRAPRRDGAPPIDEEGDRLFALAEGFSPAQVAEFRGHFVVLRPAARGGTLRGRVVAADGSPVAGARVLPRHQVGDDEPADPAAAALVSALRASRDRPVLALATSSDADGRFVLPWPWPCALRLRADHRAHGSLLLELPYAAGASDGGHVTEVELRFPPLVACELTAMAEGAAAAGISVEVMTRELGSERSVAAGLTDANGRLQLTVPALAPLWLLLRSTGRAPTVRELVLEAVAPRVIELAPTCAARGRIAAAALGAASGNAADVAGIGLVVQLLDAESGLLLDEATVQPDGSFRLPRAPAGRPIALDLTAPGNLGQRLHETTLLPPSSPAVATEADLGELDFPVGGK